MKSNDILTKLIFISGYALRLRGEKGDRGMRARYISYIFLFKQLYKKIIYFR